MAGTFLTSNLGRLGWALLGGTLVLVGALSVWPEPIAYPKVIVPAPRILVREVPGEIRWRDRLVYVYVQPDVRAVAPSGAAEDVARFCRPLLVHTDSAVHKNVNPTPSVIRTGTLTESIVPFRKAHLFLSSMNSNGDLIGEDFGVRLPVGFSAGFEPPFNTTVRYSRFAPFREIAKGSLWYLTFRAAEAIFRP